LLVAHLSPDLVDYRESSENTPFLKIFLSAVPFKVMFWGVDTQIFGVVLGTEMHIRFCLEKLNIHGFLKIRKI
jgi:hypothetical protein